MKKNARPSLSFKVSKILNGIFLIFLLILLRVWYLSIYQHEEKERASEKPQKRTIIVKADRATIRDRFGIPMAINKIQYNVSVCYAEIREIPKIKWIYNERGKKTKFLQRKEYITQLSKFLGKELNLDSERIEDLIHAKASVIGKIPLVIKENISEQEYFRIKMLEKDMPGLHADLTAKRYYPFGQVGGEVLGYLGPISRSEYDLITSEIRELQSFLLKWEEGEIDQAMPAGYQSIEEVKTRLKEMEEKSYTINDNVGKAGIEKSFEESLRGFSGKKSYLADIRGNFLQELSQSIEPREGNRIHLTISKELQEYAERLLAENEAISVSGEFFPEKGIWVKGGGIVALDPNTGDVFALASYPRFDPNDFIRSKETEETNLKNAKVQKWLEKESFIASVWDGKEPLTRERFDLKSGAFYEENLDVTWNTYLGMILPQNCLVRKACEKIKTIKDAIFLQNKVDELLSFFKTSSFSLTASKIFDIVYEAETLERMILPERDFLQKRVSEKKEDIERIKRELSPYFSSLCLNYDKILLTDLARLAVNPSLFTPQLQTLMAHESISSYRALSSKLAPVHEALKGVLKEEFHKTDFKKWREEQGKEYLALKRKEEEEQKKKYARPYVEYLDEAEQSLFGQFFEKYRYHFLAFFLTDSYCFQPKELSHYALCIIKLREKILQGALAQNLWVNNALQIRENVAKIDQKLLPSYLKTFRFFDELDRPLLGKYAALRDSSGLQMEKHLAGAFYPKHGFCVLRSHAFRQWTTIGSIFKLVPAYEALRQRYLLNQKKGKTSFDLNPLTIIDDKHKVSGKQEWNVGFTLDKKPIPLFYRGGRLPRSEHAGVGTVDLVRAIETSSNPYFALLSGDVIADPEDLCKTAKLFSFGEKTGIDLPGETPGSIPYDVIYNRSGLYAMSIGQHSLTGTPLQTAIMLASIANHGKVLKPKIVYGQVKDHLFYKTPTIVKREIFLPSPIRDTLLKGMRQVVQGENGTARGLKKEFSSDLLKHILGKTSTAEVIERVSLDGKEGAAKCKEIWFGAIYFSDDKAAEKPEIVVVVYLKFGEWGRLAAPFTIKMIEKFLEIRDRESKKVL